MESVFENEIAEKMDVNVVRVKGMPVEHFGLNLRASVCGYQLSKDNFAVFNNRNTTGKVRRNLQDFKDSSMEEYTDQWCRDIIKLCMKNYEMNMKHCSTLDHAGFNGKICSFLNEFPEFREITDLKPYKGAAGYYVLVLDAYSQLYVGYSIDITRRIRQHWSRVVPLDRVMVPTKNAESSVISIDSYRAWDTTRIFISLSNSDEQENDYIQFFPKCYLCNRIDGNIRGNSMLDCLRAYSTMNTR